MISIINGVGMILAIPFVIILIVAGYYIGEWVLNGFQDLKEEDRKKRNPLQVIIITVFGIIAIYFFLSLFKGCGDTGDIDAHRP
jgi:Na+-driven multidrug efflux pump